jgi:hypothetical protein
MQKVVSEFIAYPTNRVFGTIANAGVARDAVKALNAAGFTCEVIDILHGADGLGRLDPTGNEHGLLAQLERMLLRSTASSEFKHLNHHVDDVKAGRFVVMVAAHNRTARERVAGILHANGADFVGFDGWWAFESLPDTTVAGDGPSNATYDIGVGDDTIRLRLGSTTAAIESAADTPESPLTQIGPGMFLVSWLRHDGAAFTHVIDVDSSVAYTSVRTREGVASHSKSAVVALETRR